MPACTRPTLSPRWTALAVALWVGGPAAASEPPVLEVGRVADRGIAIDGVLDEEAWSSVQPATAFLRFVPTEGAPPPGGTEVRFLQDGRQLYVGVRVTGVDYDLRARISPRESINEDDQIGIYLDPFGDARTATVFYLNALGIQQDIRYADGRWNMNWDTVLSSRGRVTADGYELEVAIPFRSLRYPEGTTEQDWGLIVTRKIPALGAKYAFPELEPGHPRMLTQAAVLSGVTPPGQGAGLEIMPILALRQEASREQTGEALAWSGLEPVLDAVRPGIDLRYGLSPDTGLALTLLPDFSQVEGDTARIDLNPRFAFYYPEQRPFFLDGVEAFGDPLGTLYTRSIEDPLYGVKLSGREGPWSFGVLNALDRAPTASVHEYGTPGFAEEDMEGTLAENTFARVSRGVGDGGSLGMTGADKWILGGGRNTVLGADASVPLEERWTLSGAVSESLTTDGVGVSVVGVLGHAGISRSSGVGTGFGLSAGGSTAEYRREMGFLTQTGEAWASTWMDHTLDPAQPWLDKVRPSASVGAASQADGDRGVAFHASVDADLAAVHHLHAGGSYAVGRLFGTDAWTWSADSSYYGDVGARLSGGAGLGVGRELDYELILPAHGLRAWAWCQVRPTAGTRFDLSADHRRLTPQGEGTEMASSVRLRVTWQVTRVLGVRVIGETVTGSEVDGGDLRASALITWLRSPGTEAYVGTTQAWALDGRTGLTDMVVFAKVSWLFRV